MTGQILEVRADAVHPHDSLAEGELVVGVQIQCIDGKDAGFVWLTIAGTREQRRYRRTDLIRVARVTSEK